MAIAPFISAAPAPKGPYGDTAPSTKPAGQNQSALTRGQGGFLVVTYSFTSSPASVVANTSAEQTLTPVGGTGASVTPLTTSLYVVNKPTAQAGLVVGNIRSPSAGAVAVTFDNLTATPITPTASETWGVTEIRGLGTITTALTPTSVAGSTTAEQQFSVSGLKAGEIVVVNKPTSQAGLDIVGSRVIADGVLGITFGNATVTPVTPTAAENYTVYSLGGLDARGNNVGAQVTTALTGVATITVAQRTATLTNLAVTDMVVGVQKPTNQAGIGLIGGRVAAAGSLGVDFVNPTAGTLTPTANEVYGVEIKRPAPIAPLVVYQQALTPASVAANTTAEQTFTVTGVPALSVVVVNKPSAQAGLGIAGSRASAANTIGITFANYTATPITPTAGETWVIANFQVAIDAPGNSILQPADLVSDQNKVLTNAMRAVLVNAGYMKGSA